jgi:hypothetical protein
MRAAFHKNSSICPAGGPVMDEYTRQCFLTKLNNVKYKWHTFLNVSMEFDVHVTVHRDKFLIIKPIRLTNFSSLFSE